ncbi:MAG: hydroxymethylbilane synthase [Dehalococcoidales bacterium]|nr:hydroxymethylbilane synthase [Dehalococcoidales bacterium]
MKNSIIVGSRGSKLALIQTEQFVAGLREANPHIEFSISRIVTGGDRDVHKEFDAIEGSGVFVKELETALLESRINLAVHSLKDMPVELPPRLCLAAIPKRVDPRDVLISAGSTPLADLPAGAGIGTGSPRRTIQLNAYRPDLKAQSIRGNVDSRIRRVTSGELAGVIIAAAGLIRLGWEDRISEYLPVEHFLPAVGQGALAIETRLGDKDIAALLLPFNHLPTEQSVTAERALLRALGGGCRAPIAALGTVTGKTLKLRGVFANPDGSNMQSAVEEGPAAEAEKIGIRLAKKLLELRSAGVCS